MGKIMKDKIHAKGIDISIYTTKYTQVAETVSFPTTALSRRIDFTRLGLSALLNSRMLDLKRIIILPTFKPPPVEPAQAPININRTNMVRLKAVH